MNHKNEPGVDSNKTMPGNHSQPRYQLRLYPA